MTSQDAATLLNAYAEGMARAKARQPSEPDQPPAYYTGYYRQLRRNPITIYTPDGRKVRVSRTEADATMRLLSR